MAFIRKIKRKNGIYFAEVENKWIDGKCVQKHIRYIGKGPKSPTKSLKKEYKLLEKIDIIRALDEGKSKSDIAKIYNVTIKTVDNIKKRFDKEGIQGLIHTRKTNTETIKVSTHEQASIITDFVKNPEKEIKEIKKTTFAKASISEIKKLIAPISEYLKLKKKIILQIE